MVKKYGYKMTRYTSVKVNISEGQKGKLQHAIKAGLFGGEYSSRS